MCHTVISVNTEITVRLTGCQGLDLPLLPSLGSLPGRDCAIAFKKTKAALGAAFQGMLWPDG
jgi:hypothetical protein